MVIDSDELQRISEEVYNDRIIPTSLYCDQCGYNLRHLPYVHACPECGNAYNARPLKMEGVFWGFGSYFPFGYLAGTVITGLIAAAMVWYAVEPALAQNAAITAGGTAPPRFDWNKVDTSRLIWGGILALLTLAWLRKAYRQFLRFLHVQEIRRRMDGEGG